MKPELIILLVFLLLQAATVYFVFPAWKRAAKTYRPMLVFLVLYFLLALMQAFIPGKPFVIAGTNYIQYLVALLLLTWQAKAWQVFDKRPWFFWVWIVTGLGCWIIERIINDPSRLHIIWFYTGCSIILTLMVIEMMNSYLPVSRSPFYKNPVHLFGTGLLLSFALWGLMDLYSVSWLSSEKIVAGLAYFLCLSLSILIQLLFIQAVRSIPNKESVFF